MWICKKSCVVKINSASFFNTFYYYCLYLFTTFRVVKFANLKKIYQYVFMILSNKNGKYYIIIYSIELYLNFQVLRIKAETYVLVWDHIASLLENEDISTKLDGVTRLNVGDEYLREANEFIRLKWVTSLSLIFRNWVTANCQLICVWNDSGDS